MTRNNLLPPRMRVRSRSFFDHYGQQTNFEQSINTYGQIGSMGLTTIRNFSSSPSWFSRHQNTHHQSHYSTNSMCFDEVKDQKNSMSQNLLLQTTVEEVIDLEHCSDIGPLSTFYQSIFNSINLLCGLGLVSYPFAIRCAGWSGMLVLLAFTLCTYYTAILLGRCIECSPGARTFPDIGREAFGRPLEIFIGVIFFIELYLAGSVGYLVLEGDNLNKLFPESSKILFMVVISAIVVPSTWLRDFSILSYISAFGVLSSLVLLGAIVYTGISQQFWSESDTEQIVFRLSTFPQSIGLLMIGFGGHAVFPNIYTQMSSRSRYRSMLSVTYIVVFVIYGATAVIGYATFGESTSQEITLNLGSGKMATFVTWCIVLNPLSKYALTLSPIVMQVKEIVPNTLYYNTAFQHIDHAVIGTMLTALALITAVFIPMFDRLLEFTGSLCTFTVSITFPALCHLRICGWRLSRIEYIFNVLLVLLGITCSFVGTMASVYGPLPTNFEIRF